MGIVSVIVDSREPQFMKNLVFGGVPVAVAMLDAGDILVATDDNCLLACERKASGDFLNSLRDERLFPQLARLRDVSPYAYLIITGTLHSGPNGHCVTDERESGWNWASVSGAMLTIQEIGVHIIQVASDFDFEAAVIRLANRDRSKLRITAPRDATIISESEQILASLPGIGTQKAQALLNVYGVPHLALHYLTVWDKYWHHNPVAGIGDGTKRRVRKALGLDDNRYLMSGVFAGESNGKDKTNE